MGVFRCGDDVVGTIRAIPLSSGLAPCEMLLKRRSDLLAAHREDGWEVGRLVLAPQFRSGPDELKRCLFLAICHLIRNINAKNLFASCSPPLARLYRRFGFSVVLPDACDGLGRSFSLIHASSAAALLALASGAPRPNSGANPS